jgi:two-component system chemotaxis response regulator CheY
MTARAVIIDDSRATRLLIARNLRAIGIESVEFGDAESALDMLYTGPIPHLALIDRNMPGIGGLGFIRSVRADPQFSDLCLLMVTSETAPERVAEAFEAGCDEYLMKPFTTEALLEKLQMLGFTWEANP